MRQKMIGNIFRKAYWSALLILLTVTAGYAVYPYRIDFKSERQAAACLERLSVIDVKEVSLTNGILRLEIGPENQNGHIWVKATGKPGPGMYGFPRSFDFNDYGEIIIKARVSTPESDRKEKYSFNLCLKTEKGKVSLPAEVKDLSGGKFEEYRFQRKETPAWQSAANVSAVSFLISSTNVSFPSLVFEIESIRLEPLASRIVDDKLALVDQTKTLYLESSLAVFKRRGLVIKDLEKQADEFKALIEQAKSCHQKKDYKGAYKYLEQAEEVDRIIYPRVRRGWKLLEVGDQIEGLEAIRKLYADKSSQKTGPELAVLLEEYKKYVERLAKGKYEIGKQIKELEEKIDREYEALDKTSPYGLSLRPGLSWSSFGRFGWLPADFDEGLLVYNLLKTPDVLGKDFDQNTKIILSSRDYNESGKILKEEKKDVTWVSFQRDVVFEGKDGKEIHWNYLCSLLAPGILLNTDANNLLLSQKRKKSLSPDWVIIPEGQGCKVYELAEGVELKPEMKENWVLLFWPGQERYNPVLLTFERRPETLKKEGKNISVTRSGGIGQIGITDYEGMMPFDYRGIDQWRENVPVEVIKRCRLISQVMTDYPVFCREYYALDEDKRQVLVVNEIEYHPIRDEWETPLKEYAPIPPLVSYLKDQKYSSLSVAGAETDFGISTKYGPYRAVAGSRLEYRIPLPDFNHRCYLKAEGTNLDSNIKLYGAAMSRMPADNVPDAPAWNVMDKQRLARMLERERQKQSNFQAMKYSSQWGISEGYPRLNDGQTSNTPPYSRPPENFSEVVDRVEPFVGKEYAAIGWNTLVRTNHKGRESIGAITYGDMGNGVGINIAEILYYYALYSGDWDYIRKNWPFIKRMCLVMGRMDDWADLTLTYDERIADNYVDMGPDCLKLPVCFMRMAEAIGDMESYRWAAYIAAKHSLNRNSMFVLGEYMRKYSNIAGDGGYCLDMGVGEMGCDIKDYANMPWQDIVESDMGKKTRIYAALFQNIWTGCVPMLEDYDSWIQYVPEQAARLAFGEFPAYLPDWDTATMANIDLSRYLLARIYLDDGDDDILWDYFLSVGTMMFGPAQKLNFAMLQGRDAPVYLVDWQPNRLKQGIYDLDANKAKIEIEAVQPAVVKLKSVVQPVAVWDNDKLVSQQLAADYADGKTKSLYARAIRVIRGLILKFSGGRLVSTSGWWEYNPARKILTVRIDKGFHTLALDYPGWTKPQRKKIAVNLENVQREITRKKQVQIVGEEKYSTTNQCVTLDISRQANMGFADEKADDQQGGLFDEGRSLMNFLPGGGKFAGIPFRIIDPAKNNAKSCIVLKGRGKPYFPGKAEGIEVKRKFKNLYVLHNAGYCASDGEEVYRIRLNYADGTQKELEVLAGENIRDWFFKPGRMNELMGAKMGWQGKAAGRKEGGGKEEIEVTMYCALFANPYPEKEVRTIDLLWGNTKAVPAIFALTVEE